MPRLLLLITDLELGGTPIVVRELAMRLRDERTHVEVACLKPAGIVGDQLRAAGITVTSFDARKPTQMKRVVRDLVARVRAERIETVFSFLVHANFIASRAAKQLPDVRFLQSIQTTQPRPRWHWWLQKRIHHRAARVVVPSESVAKRAIEWANVPRAKLVVIPNAIDVFRGTGAPPVIHERGAHATKTRIGFVGRLDPVKRVNDLLDALTLLPGVSLDIFGDGGERAALEAITANLGLRDRVSFHGQISDVRRAYEQIDLLVLPSEAEGFGLVLIEAMAAGVPVVATDVDGIRDVVDKNETGVLVPPKNPPALAAAIQMLLADPARREMLVANARAAVANRFTWDAVLPQYRALLQID